jgi:hypothetical protein
MKNNTLTTVLHHYRFDLTNADERAMYETLRANVLEKLGFPVWPMHADFHSYNDRKVVQDFMDQVELKEGEIELETECLFDNQWNAERLRLFNWAECIFANKDIKEGYYLEQTAEMREVLRNTHKCGYCGSMEPAAKGYVFCPYCLGSEYLTVEQLHLTRMVSVSDTNRKRAPLTPAEQAHLLPLFREAQNGTKARKDDAQNNAQSPLRLQAIARENAQYEKKERDARNSRDVALWVLNAPLPVRLESEVIWYGHTGRVCFGWNHALSADDVAQLLEVISEFPWPYDIKCADGRVLSGG